MTKTVNKPTMLIKGQKNGVKLKSGFQFGTPKNHSACHTEPMYNIYNLTVQKKHLTSHPNKNNLEIHLKNYLILLPKHPVFDSIHVEYTIQYLRW